MKLLRPPAHDVSKLFRDLAGLRPSHLRKHDTVAIASDELHWDVEVEQTRQRFTGHRARKHIAADDDVVDVCLTDILEYSLERGKVRMNIVDCSDPHRKCLIVARL